MRTLQKWPLAGALLAPLAVAALLAAPGSASSINPIPPGVIDIPTVTGLHVGQTLTASVGKWGGNTPMTYHYIWMRSDGSGYAAIPGAGSMTYTVTEADIGHRLMFQIKAVNEDGWGLASSSPTSIVTGSTVADTQQLANGATSVLVDRVTLPNRLVVAAVTSTPTVLTRGGTVTVIVDVKDRFGHPVRGALVQVIPFPYGVVTKPAELTTAADGTATVTLKATAQLTSDVKLVGLYVQARKSGDNVLEGVTGTRLVNLRVGR